ncbi:hypothetical protein ACFWOG_20510 [Kitasatospora sp. NPDC058406]|uniref:hypothetical protein n=1 Tax=Kitasatospora sp. NPDC058406 TaxID=3346483 RepID=UPI0036685152
MSDLAVRPTDAVAPAAPLDPRDDWPAGARGLREDLVAEWGKDDPWVAVISDGCAFPGGRSVYEPDGSGRWTWVRNLPWEAM